MGSTITFKCGHSFTKPEKTYTQAKLDWALLRDCINCVKGRGPKDGDSVAELRAQARALFGGGTWIASANKEALQQALATRSVPENTQPPIPRDGGDSDMAKKLAAIAEALAPFGTAKQAQIDPELVRKIAREEIQKGAPVTIEIKRLDMPDLKLSGVHERVPLLVKFIHSQVSSLLVGPAGSGKSQGAVDAAKALSIPALVIPLGPHTTQADLFGFHSATGNYVETPFFRAYTGKDEYAGGAVIVLDELDRCNERVAVTLNQALANGHCTFPCGMKERAANARFVGTANTAGHGADRLYVSARQQDAALLDRFAVIQWQYDKKLERAIVNAINPEHAESVLDLVFETRQALDSIQSRYLVTPRASIYCARLMLNGVSKRDAVQAAIVKAWDADTLVKVRSKASSLDSVLS